ncbi:sucrose nonfermenting 4-like protein [Lotus japonicus]|uniref:sucrose nonfermenting 4-like protein n=1 Tax=Lotus japonicus TaxID=34305 RepID=UPI002588083C|nr:sucrose nonfermenting 4-like protein [Lotus japonicus]XP_057427317.1 sucrose nonfermenting 4-like protein [Lotus japonicus]
MSGSMASLVARPPLVPKRFVWPYGGRTVFLCGSFTRWQAIIPMSRMDSCPDVFEVLCSLIPGYHQYNFYVDGKWRHDEQQPFVNEIFGVVNSIYLLRQPDILSTLLSAETPGGGHMEVDNSASGPVEANPMMSESDLLISRHRISTFLSRSTAYDLLPESGKVIALDINLSVKQALSILHEEGIYLAPICDSSTCQFVGVLNAMDFIQILKELGNHGTDLTEEQLETYTIADWREGKLLQCETNCNGRARPWNFVSAGPDECLKDVASKILQNNVATVPIIHSSSEHGSLPQLLRLASLSDILKHICRYFEHSHGFLPVLQLPVGSIPLGTWVQKMGESNIKPLAMLGPNDSLGAAMSLMIEAEVSSIPIVHDNDSLLDIYSRSDITALVKKKAYAWINLDEFSIHEALLLVQDGELLYNLPNGQRYHMCSRFDSLCKVMELLAEPGVERVLIVKDGTRRVEGIISIGDVFRFLLG